MLCRGVPLLVQLPMCPGRVTSCAVSLPSAVAPPLLQLLQWPDGGSFKHDTMMAMFGFQGFEAMRDPLTDTRALLAWRDGCLLLAFRGTASKANAVTDLKAWKAPVLPQRRHHGRLVKVHAGGWAGG